MTNKNHEEEPVSDLQALLTSVKENPLPYVGGFAVILIVVIATLLFQLNSDLTAKDQASEYASALDIEDPMERMIALGEITEGNSKYGAEALYMQGFAALDSEDYETAEYAFTTLRETHPDFEFTPDAVEGLGTVRERNDDYAGAIVIYKEIQATWPESFAARRQPFNVGRCQQESENFEEAMQAYRDQLQTFPGSNVAMDAQLKLDQLEAAHPALAQAQETLEVSADAPQDAVN